MHSLVTAFSFGVLCGFGLMAALLWLHRPLRNPVSLDSLPRIWRRRDDA